ncbi:PqqD family peptide modification chaperone [uncultured Phocaeicola sp.]|nr:PqqD family peptide modification chaperone [uncultured Phocaeicola sp.]
MKYYRINQNVLFRHFGDFGYITDNRNFGYNLLGSNFTLGDEIISETGADIVSCLKKTPLSIDEIMNKVVEIFEPETELRSSVIEFLELLCSKGFILSGDSVEECSNCDAITRNDNQRLAEDDSNTIDTQEFLSKYYKERPFPTSIHVEIASECNERCIHCYIPHEFKQDLMDENLFNLVLSQAIELNLLHITISGGEPMLHPRFIDFMRKCREADMSVNILSNLTLLNNEMIEEMKLNPLLSVQTSIYSMQENIHDGITHQKGSLNKTVASVIKLIENHIPVQISCPILKNNVNSYREVKEWAVKHNISAGIDYSIIAQYNHNKKNINCRLSIEELKNFISEQFSSDSLFRDEIEKEITERRKKTGDDYICSICNSSICIGPNGNVFPCVGWSSKILGNIKSQSLQDVWMKSEAVKQLRAIRFKDFVNCRNCSSKDFCTICMVRNSNESSSGDQFELNQYFCDMAKIKKEIYNGC